MAACVAPAGYAPPGDCDPADPTVSPWAVEAPHDGVDQDCDGAELLALAIAGPEADGTVDIEVSGAALDLEAPMLVAQADADALGVVAFAPVLPLVDLEVWMQAVQPGALDRLSRVGQVTLVP